MLAVGFTLMGLGGAGIFAAAGLAYEGYRFTSRVGFSGLAAFAVGLVVALVAL